MQKMNWGILGCGKIASQLAEGFGQLPDARIVACASRTGKERAFADAHSIPNAHSDYESLVTRSDVDVVYIANTNNAHYESMLLALHAGKHVLCEKPFTINAAQAAEVIDLARAKNLFLMEAMWTRFLPAIATLREWLAAGLIGDLKKLQASFCTPLNCDPAGRILNPTLGGSSMLDLGIYPISLASLIFGGAPSRMSTTALLGETGVDERSEYLFEYENGACALLSSAVRFHSRISAEISGSDGWIRLPDRFHGAQQIQWGRGDEIIEDLPFPFDGKGLHFEVAEVNRCIRESQIESAIMPLDETLEIMRTMDALRSEWGLVYPEEK